MKLGVYYRSLTQTERSKFLSLLSDELSKSEVTIRSYINGNRKIQPSHANKISALTNGEVTVVELCPDVFGDAA